MLERRRPPFAVRTLVTTPVHWDDRRVIKVQRKQNPEKLFVTPDSTKIGLKSQNRAICDFCPCVSENIFFFSLIAFESIVIIIFFTSNVKW